ncbi:MAG TPA: T9SS type A sorting domain-containing protein, partial [Tenuifilaceae bacterium]|nr:T9SS type A sorting domain-containing protein [Tenuifilaceae bacterium]
RIKATDQEGNFSESTIQNYTVSPATGIGDNQQDKITVYPNPFGETLNVKVDGSGLTKVTVMDIIGKVVYTAEFADKTYPINTSNLKTGIYILKVLNGNKTNVIRVVKR